MEFLVRGATLYDEPGVFMAFEETPEELAQNVRSLGFDLDELVSQEKLVMDYVRIEPNEIDEVGEYDLEGLFVRLGHAIDSIGAKRVVLDTIESLFGGLSNQAILRAELRRLFRWLKDRGVTAVITGERGDGSLTRQGLEEYVSDCVILLDHRITDQISTRRLRIVKYRGTAHGTNEYPFLIDETGFGVLPITSLGLEHTVSNERISSGIPALDTMLGGAGYFRGSTILISGMAGTGKTTLAAHFADACCRRGERCLFFAFEESKGQIVRNMRSVGIDLERWMDQGLLQHHANRPSTFGLEMHLAIVHRLVTEFQPHAVILDPMSTILHAGSSYDATIMLIRLIDYLKVLGVTSFMTSLSVAGKPLEHTDTDISSIVDTWVLLRSMDTKYERRYALHVLKSRGMAHSNQLRPYTIGDGGIQLTDHSRASRDGTSAAAVRHKRVPTDKTRRMSR
jgi:circadian clock protein KaiC